MIYIAFAKASDKVRYNTGEKDGSEWFCMESTEVDRENNYLNDRRQRVGISWKFSE